MTGRFLYLPNNYSLSDNDIDGGVVQRVASHHHELESKRNVYRTYTSARNLGDAEVQQSHSFTSQKHLPLLKSFTGTTASCHFISQHEAASPRKMHVSASRRERCWINQAQYRKRLRKHADDLDACTRQLKEEVQDLETRRQAVLRCAPTNDSVWIVATEYFRLFRHGYTDPVAVEKPSFSSSFIFDMSQIKQSHSQLDFFRASISPDVTDGTLFGAESLLKNWRLLSLYFGDVQVKLKRLEQGSTINSLVGKTMTSLTIIEKTLRCVFPHLVSSGELSPLALRLLNQRLDVHGSVHFDWDATSGRVMRLESKIDMLSTMPKLLGNLEDVGCVFENSLVTPEGKYIEHQTTYNSSPLTTKQSQ